MLDRGAILTIDQQLTAPKNAGVGYILFSVAMVIGRLTDSKVVGLWGEFWMLITSDMITIFGIATVLLAPLKFFFFNRICTDWLGCGQHSTYSL